MEIEYDFFDPLKRKSYLWPLFKAITLILFIFPTIYNKMKLATTEYLHYLEEKRKLERFIEKKSQL